MVRPVHSRVFVFLTGVMVFFSWSLTNTSAERIITPGEAQKLTLAALTAPPHVVKKHVRIVAATSNKTKGRSHAKVNFVKYKGKARSASAKRLISAATYKKKVATRPTKKAVVRKVRSRG